MKDKERYVNCQDDTLLSLVNKGDHAAFTEIYNRYSALLYQQAHRILCDAETCHDIVQDVFLFLWSKRGELQIKRSLYSYLFKTVRNRVLNHISHHQVMEKYIYEIRDFLNECGGATDEAVLKKELLNIIETEKMRLPPRTRQLYELNREQDITYKEIGQQLDISEKTVKKQVHNALRAIRLKINSLMQTLFL